MENLISPEESRARSGGISPSTQRRWILAKDYPQPIVLSRDRHGKPVRVVFVASEVDAWVKARIESGRGAA